jgi:hypothetical protein
LAPSDTLVDGRYSPVLMQPIKTGNGREAGQIQFGLAADVS